MHKYLLSFFIVAFISISGFSQRLENYKPLISKGKIPKEFIELSSKKYLIEEKAIDKNETPSRKALKKKFLLESNFHIDDILSSGTVLFNDSLTNYINGVADYLLKDQQELRDQLQFYTIKSTEVNAFATDKGIIFVTLGLLSQIQSEAQLAWILSHEIIHYKYKHNIETYIESQKILKGEKEYKKTSKNVRLSAIYKYSHENESDADVKGLEEIYSKSDYSFEDVKNTFDVMLYSYLPIEEFDFNKSFFESENLKFPASYSPVNPKPIIAIEGYDDSKSTHPNIKKRREAINNTIDKLNHPDGKSFSAFSKDYFFNIRQIARFELCNTFLSDRDYEDAIFNAYSIMKKDSFSNEYLESVIGKGLYGLSKYKNSNEFNATHLKVKDIEGSKYNLVYFFEEITKKELNILALTYLFNHNIKFTKSTGLQNQEDDLLKDLVYVNKLFPDSFYIRNDISNSKLNQDTLTEAQLSKLDKYERIKYKRKKQITENPNSSNYAFALTNQLKDTRFALQFEKYKK